jgi:DNA-binding NtrC family response regulator
MKVKKEIPDKKSSARPERSSPAESLVRVMVVDDDQFVLELLDEFLTGSGYDVFTARSGEAALGRIKTGNTDIALVDYKLPGMDGLETIKRINQISPDTVTIIMTGFPTLDSSISAIRLGASDYILKPFKLNEVSLSLQKATKERSMKSEMNQLRKRISELESNISEKRDTIKINRKIGVVPGPHGYSATRFTRKEPDNSKSDP